MSKVQKIVGVLFVVVVVLQLLKIASSFDGISRSETPAPQQATFTAANVRSHEAPKAEQRAVVATGNKATKAKYDTGELSLIQLPINKTTTISYFSRNQIFDERKNYVAKSLFGYSGYDPARSTALAQIEDGKPWIGLDQEGDYGGQRLMLSGPSEETRFLNNPDILVGIHLDVVQHRAKPDSKIAYNILPVKLSYAQNEKTVIVEYNFSNYFEKSLCEQGEISYHNFGLTGMNARDLGYSYAYVDSKENLFFKDGNQSIEGVVTEFQDFIHTGGSCEISGGCSNGSPRQDNLVFQFNEFPKNRPSYMSVKLWRKLPASKNTPADTNLIMIFR